MGFSKGVSILRGGWDEADHGGHLAGRSLLVWVLTSGAAGGWLGLQPRPVTPAAGQSVSASEAPSACLSVGSCLPPCHGEVCRSGSGPSRPPVWGCGTPGPCTPMRGQTQSLAPTEQERSPLGEGACRGCVLPALRGRVKGVGLCSADQEQAGCPGDHGEYPAPICAPWKPGGSEISQEG